MSWVKPKLFFFTLFLFVSCRTHHVGINPLLAAYKCPETCIPPACFCPQSAPPGRLNPKETPQFLLLSFDDAVTSESFKRVQPFLNRKNPNGCPVKATFFVTNDDTDYLLIRQLHAAGHEIAVHTITHNTDLQTSYRRWLKELAGSKKALANLSKIPNSEISGFRAPYLKYNPEMFKALAELKFTYDSSVSEVPGVFSSSESSMIWPYTLDFGVAQRCFTGECPAKPLRGIFEIPMHALESERQEPVAMDPEGTSAEILELYRNNFLKHFEGNRAPFGIYLHARWLEKPGHAQALSEFLKQAQTLPDVQMITFSDLIKYMRRPVPSSEFKNNTKCS